MATTYTLLVTIAHDAGAAPSTDLVEAMVQRGLEEGVRGMAGVEAATVSAVAQDWLGIKLEARSAPIEAIKRLHKELRA